MTSKTFSDFGIELPPQQFFRGDEVDTTCPQCSPHRKKQHDRCLSVNVAKAVWDCKHCGWAGGLGGGVHTSALLPAPDAPAREYSRPGIIPGPDAITPEARAWFASRGIPEAVLRRNKITTQDVFMGSLGEKARAIAYPSFRNGELIAVKFRAAPKHFQSAPNCERILFGLDDIDGAETVVIVEGEMDKLAVEAAGVTTCVSVPDGAPPPDVRNYATKLAYLDEDVAAARLAAAKTIILAVDGDAPGRKLEEELARRLGRGRVKLVVWPEGCKDANEVLMTFGAESLAEVIATARPFPIDGVIAPYDLADRLDDLYNNGLPGGRSTGLVALDKGYTVKPGQLTIWTAIPGSGKSELLDQIMVNLADERGPDEPWRFAIYSPENHPAERHLAKLLAKWTRKPFGADAGHAGSRLARMTRDERDRALREMSDKFHFLNPEEPTLDAILELAAALVARNGINGLVIDPWNEVSHDRGDKFSETEYISASLSKLRRFARAHDVHVWVVAHPAKMYKVDGEYPVPTPYDISGSAHWFNKADNAITVHRDKTNEDGLVEVHVQKIRFRECGSLGRYDLSYDWRNGCYGSPPEAKPLASYDNPYKRTA